MYKVAGSNRAKFLQMDFRARFRELHRGVPYLHFEIQPYLVAIVLALGIPADIYLIDEPSAYLDAERKFISPCLSLLKHIHMERAKIKPASKC